MKTKKGGGGGGKPPALVTQEFDSEMLMKLEINPMMMMQQMMMQNQMTQQNLQNQNNNQGYNQNQQQTPPAPKPSRDEIMKSLKDLGELKSMGILTEAEFEQKKKELLAQL